ncbi:hypothetical protein NliqN6_0156 [Naganishia liquefaciens]|uniref:Chromo domain-containing protein n=1 Tax=Naganishia liquefaciens TaxID=104408 RepID=A0A8H3YBY2_9TREE|nr:hypothetical protein NliqN6_0156 [Naganishia liquefaciens]
MEGIPAHLHPIIRANSTEVRNIEDFRRVLIDLEPGIRDVKGFAPHTNRTTTHMRSSQVNNASTLHAKDNRTNSQSRRENKGSPKTPCRCGAMHWYADCPHKRKTAEVNQAQKAPPATFPNNIPIGQQGKWKPWSHNTKEAKATEINTVQVQSRRNPKRQSRARILDAPATKPTENTDTLEKTKPRITPTFALARFDAKGICHPICIDTGSSISCIDADYARRYLPETKVTPTSNLRLMGVGTNMTSGSLTTTLSFVTTNPEKDYEVRVTLYIVPRLNTKILLGNDYLVPLNPTINFEENWMKFAENPLRIMITNRRVSLEPQEARTARTRQVFTVQPGHQATIPVLLYPEVEAEMYCIEASQPLKDVYVARSVAHTDSNNHFAMVTNFGKNAVKIPTGEDLEYEVDHIKDHRKSKQHGMQYLVSWLNYPPEEDSWEPAENLTGAQDAIREYWKKEEGRTPQPLPLNARSARLQARNAA